MQTNPSSPLWQHASAVFELGLAGGQKSLLIHNASPGLLEGFSGSSSANTFVAPLSASNAAALREAFPVLKPKLLGLQTSAGFGDRLGLATPGHVRALQAVGSSIAPIFAQQSIREMTRTARTPQAVLDDATWGAFEAGWQQGVGADADHLKTPEDIERCAAAGFTLFTLDPSAQVDNQADAYSPQALRDKLAQLPWSTLQSTAQDLERYAGKRVDLGHRTLQPSLEEVQRFGVKYGAAIAHVRQLEAHLQSLGVPYELEVSVDESDSPTSAAEHYLFAQELRRLGVGFVSLAPRFVGSFEKGVDYIGDLNQLAHSLRDHAAIARLCGPYKLSLHSGSDKFSVYPLIAEATGGQVHLKTAGTSYLEALRVVAQYQPDLFAAIWSLAKARFEIDKASYHISGQLTNLPLVEAQQYPSLLEHFDARQVLHVTFGSVLAEFKPQLMEALQTHQEAHYRGLSAHFERHLRPFVG